MEEKQQGLICPHCNKAGHLVPTGQTSGLGGGRSATELICKGGCGKKSYALPPLKNEELTELKKISPIF